MSDKIFNEVRLIPPVQIIKYKNNGIVIVDSTGNSHHFTGDGNYDGYDKNKKSKVMENKFEIWGVVQLLGHNKIAGKLTEQNIAGANMLRVDVPETKKNPAFTRFFSSEAIYSIDPATEKFVVAYAKKLDELEF